MAWQRSYLIATGKQRWTGRGKVLIPSTHPQWPTSSNQVLLSPSPNNTIILKIHQDTNPLLGKSPQGSITLQKPIIGQPNPLYMDIHIQTTAFCPCSTKGHLHRIMHNVLNLVPRVPKVLTVPEFHKSSKPLSWLRQTVSCAPVCNYKISYILPRKNRTE